MNADETTQQEFHLRDYWQVLVRRRWIVYTCVLITTLAAAVASFLATPVFSSTAQLSIERSGIRLLRQNLTSAEPSWIDYQNFYNTQYQILASSRVMEEAVKSLDLPNRDVFGEDEGEKNEFLVKLAEIKRKALRSISRAPSLDPVADDSLQPYIEQLHGMISITPVRDSHLVNITAIHKDPNFAAEAANAVFDAYNQFTLSEKKDLAENSKVFLAKQIADLRKELVGLEHDFNAYAKKYSIVQGSSKDAAVEDLIELRKQLTEAKTQVAEKEAVLAGKLSSDPSSLPQVRQSASIQDLNESLNQLERSYTSMKANLGDGLPAVKTAKAKRDSARKRLETEEARIAKQVIDTARSELSEATRNEENLSRLYAEQIGRVEGQQGALSEYESLRALVARKRSTLNDLLTRQNDMEISSNLGEANHTVRLIDRAIPSRIVFRPKKKLNIMLGFLFGLFLGVGAAILMEYIDNTLKTPDDVRNVLGASVLGLIPAFETVPASRGKRRQGTEARIATDPAMVTAQTPSSPIAESYRELRTALLLTTAGHPPREIAVTSCQPSEGKTTTAINLASALTQLSRKVLLVDADLRRPRCHHVLKVKASQGLSTFLSGMSGIKGLYQPTAIEGLSLLPAGPVPPNPAELLDSNRYLEFLKELRGLDTFDHIIFDTPPILSVVDPLIVARHSEGLVLVIRSAFTSREAGRLGLEKLTAGRVSLLGIVLNAVQTDHVPYQYRYYRYGYSQDSKRKKKKKRRTQSEGEGASSRS